MLNGTKIKQLRQAKKLSLRKLCKMAEGSLSPSYLSEIENNKVANPSKKLCRTLAKVLGVKEFELFTFVDYVEGEFKMCIHRREYPTMDGWVYYCDLAASGKQLTAKELSDKGCTKGERKKCKKMMEYTCGIGIVPECYKDFNKKA